MSTENTDSKLDNPQLDLAAESFDTDAVQLSEGEDLEADVDAPEGFGDL